VDEEVRELQAALDGREEAAGETAEVEAVEPGEEGAFDEERGEELAIDQAPEEDLALAEEEHEDAPEEDDEDDQPTVAEHEEPRA
jgi:hypothetical protein